MAELERVALGELALALGYETLAADERAVGAARVGDEPGAASLPQHGVPRGHR
jgi:hypothetical protein